MNGGQGYPPERGNPSNLFIAVGGGPLLPSDGTFFAVEYGSGKIEGPVAAVALKPDAPAAIKIES